MAVRRVLTFPDPLLHRVSRPVEHFDNDLSLLVTDMIETMRREDGIGLAAPQVGELLRLIVVEVAPAEGEAPILYSVCNPTITRREGDARIEEGCLSLPGFYVEVDRAEKIRLEGQNPDGSPLALDADGLLAICFQHEIDHLDGRLLVNYVSSTRREVYRSEVKKKARDGASEPGRSGAL